MVVDNGCAGPCRPEYQAGLIVMAAESRSRARADNICRAFAGGRRSRKAKTALARRLSIFFTTPVADVRYDAAWNALGLLLPTDVDSDRQRLKRAFACGTAWYINNNIDADVSVCAVVMMVRPTGLYSTALLSTNR